MKKPEPLRLPANHDPATCTECAAITRDGRRRRERIERMCRCCGTHIPSEHTIYSVGDIDVPACIGDWRMCGSCWRAGYQVGETVDSDEQRRTA